VKFSLKGYSLADLQRLLARVQTEISKRSEKNRKAVLRELERIAKKSGFDLASLLGAKSGGTVRKATGGGKRGTGKRRKVAPKYRHPKEKGLTWTGRGRKPKWVVEWLAGKGTLEQLAIK
jgi:DNA-binding protein H-NS